MPSSLPPRLTRQDPPEIEVLLLSARQHPDREAADRIAALCRDKSFKWAVLAATAASHEIAPLVLTNLQNAGAIGTRAPSAIVERWKDLKLRNVLNKKRQAQAAGRSSSSSRSAAGG